MTLTARLVGVLIAALVPPAVAAQDRAVAPSDVTVVAGRVVTDGADASPLRRVSVTLTPVDGPGQGFAIVTEDDGSFRFDAVPSGRYQLGARKPGYVPANFGAARPGRPGTPVVVSAGTPRTDLTLRLVKGAVITGRIVDAQGDPASSVGIQVFRVRSGSGRPILDDGGEQMLTDDRGVYRIFGLAPGDYAVTAIPQWFGDSRSMAATGTVDVQWAERMLRSQGRTDEAPPASQHVGYAHVFYPGTTNHDQAQIITLEAGAERSGIDFGLPLVPMARLDGKVVGPDGAAVEARIFLVPEDSSPLVFPGLHEGYGSDFSFRALTPGTYTLLARSGGRGDHAIVDAQVELPPGMPERRREPPPAMWAMTSITIGTTDLKDVVLTLQPALTVSGRLSIDATTRESPKFEEMRVQLLPIAGDQRLAFVATGEVQRDGRFTVENLMPGRYQVGVPGGPHGVAPEWSLRSVVVGERNVTDQPIELLPNRPPGDVIVTLTDRVTSLRGSLVNANKRPAPDFYIIAFPRDRAFWIPESRRIQSTRPATDGTFLFKLLPPGDYLIAALTDVDGDEWREAAFLEQLVSSAVGIRVVEGTTNNLPLTTNK